MDSITITNDKNQKLNAFRKEQHEWIEEQIRSKKLKSIQISTFLSEKELTDIDAHAQSAVEIKIKELHHKNDGKKEYERIWLGKVAEFIFAKTYDLPLPDLTVGPSKNYDKSDVIVYGREFGIKASKIGNAALVHKKPKRREIIIIKNDDIMYIAGIATIDSMMKNIDDDLLRLAMNPNKSGFTMEGYKTLYSIDDAIEELKVRQAKKK